MSTITDMEIEAEHILRLMDDGSGNYKYLVTYHVDKYDDSSDDIDDVLTAASPTTLSGVDFLRLINIHNALNAADIITITRTKDMTV